MISGSKLTVSFINSLNACVRLDAIFYPFHLSTLYCHLLFQYKPLSYPHIAAAMSKALRVLQPTGYHQRTDHHDENNGGAIRTYRISY